MSAAAQVTWGLPRGARIVDCHAHLGRYTRTNVIRPSAEDMLPTMDRLGVEKLCLSSFLSIGPDEQAGNDMVAEAVRKHPDRFVGYAVVNPNRPAAILGELERCFDRLGMKAIKLHPAFHQYPITGSAYRKVFPYADKRSIPILSHDWGGPEFLEKLATDYPRIRYIIAHTGSFNGRTDFRYAAVMKQHANVFVELALSNIFYDALELMVEQVGARQILFGSDVPLHDLAYQLGRVAFAKLTDETKLLIVGGNMLRILGQ